MKPSDNTSFISDDIAAQYEGKTILVTGAAGFIGSKLSQALSTVSRRLFLLDLPGWPPYIPDNAVADIECIQADITSSHCWQSALPGVDYLFHLAALEYNRKNFDIERDLHVNAVSVYHLLECCCQNNLHPKIIFSSSANIFGIVDKLPVNETFPANPPSLWSAHKLLAENYFRTYAQRHGIESLILRLANVYGPTADKNAQTSVIINKVITAALSGSGLVTYPNRNCLRDFIYIDDIISAFLYAGAADRSLFDGRFYVIGGGQSKTIAQIWQIIADKLKVYTKRNISIETDDSPKLEPLDMRQFVADYSAFRDVTGWKPKISIDEGIALTIEALNRCPQQKHAHTIR
ncbi:MAG: NAD-dependent epimerase/dehydratase family protein [Sedimentisphaerales bacterium]|nr:NAD-dependent epimerase/dehydratase family protein [Sedimentisphaerales bacterium]